MLALSDRSADALQADAKKARGGNKAAAARIEKERTEANAYMAKFGIAYASTRPPQVDDEASRERQGKARAKREGERRDAFAGRTDEAGRVVFATPAVRRAAGGGR